MRICIMILLMQWCANVYGKGSQVIDTVSEAKPAVIYGEITYEHPVDTLSLTFLEQHIYPYSKVPLPLTLQVLTTPGNLFEGTISERTFKIELPPFSNPAYIQLGTKGYNFLEMYIVEPGDSVLVKIDTKNGRMAFWGNAGEKFRVQYELGIAEEMDQLNANPIMLSYAKKDTKERFFKNELHLRLYTEAKKKQETGYGRLLTYINPGDEEIEYFAKSLQKDVKDTYVWAALQRNKNALPFYFYNLLEANVIGKFLGSQVGVINRHSSSTDSRIERAYTSLLRNHPVSRYPEQTILYAESFMDYLTERTVIMAIRENKSFSAIVMDQYSGEIRDKIYARFILKNYKRLPNGGQAFIEKAREFIETPWIKNELELLYETQKVGAQMEFELENDKGQAVSLSNFKGKVVLLDFWFTGCGACVTLYKHTLSKVIAHFKNNDKFVKISISADKDKQKWLKSIKSGEYTSPSSVNLTTNGYQHELLRKYNVHAYPHMMLIDEQGKIAKSGGLVLNAAELISIIEEQIAKTP